MAESNGYSRLQHMVNALRGNHDPRRTVVSLLTSQITAYFDGGGAPHQLKNLVLVVGGFVATEERWLAFRPEWQKVLNGFGIETFHMSDFIVSKRAFATWKDDEDKRKDFLKRLCQKVIDLKPISFASGVNLWDWQLVNLNYELEENDLQPYALAGWSVVERVKDWCAESGLDPMHALYTFEDGDLHQDNMRRRVRRDFGIIVQTETKKNVTELQSADFGAWQFLNVMREYEKGNDFRESAEPWLVEVFVSLFRNIQYKHRYFSMRDLGKRSPSLLRL